MKVIAKNESALSSNLSSLLKENKISAVQLAKKTGVPKSNIASWINGANPNIYQLSKIGQFFQLSLEELMFGKKSESGNEHRSHVRDDKIFFKRYEITIKEISPDS